MCSHALILTRIRPPPQVVKTSEMYDKAKTGGNLPAIKPPPDRSAVVVPLRRTAERSFSSTTIQNLVPRLVPVGSSLTYKVCSRPSCSRLLSQRPPPPSLDSSFSSPLFFGHHMHMYMCALFGGP